MPKLIVPAATPIASGTSRPRRTVLATTATDTMPSQSTSTSPWSSIDVEGPSWRPLTTSLIEGLWAFQEGLNGT